MTVLLHVGEEMGFARIMRRRGLNMIQTIGREKALILFIRKRLLE